MKNRRKSTHITIIAALLAIIGFIISIPIINDCAAKKVALNIRNISLPANTEYIEMFSKAGKLVGNGNGMQYLGGILIKSELSLEELQLYFSQYSNSEWENIVERQSGKELRCIEHEMLLLKAVIDDDNYFIVYSWGDYYSVFSELDLRGH